MRVGSHLRCMGLGFGCVLALSASGCAGSNATEVPEESSGTAFEALRARETSPRWATAAIRDGANRLLALQADSRFDTAQNGGDAEDLDPDDGGWDWLIPLAQTEHTAAQSPENLYGATALALWAAADVNGSTTRLRRAQRAVAQGISERPEVDSPADFVFLTLLADTTGDSQWASLARTRYEVRTASAGSAVDYALSIRTARHASNYDGLIAYDLAWVVLGASALDAYFPGRGYAEDASSVAQLILDDLQGVPGYFDRNDPHERYYTLGLAWSLVALTHAPGRHPALRRELRQLLLDGQADAGFWGWNADYPAAEPQSTAHAVQALALTARSGARAAATRGARWLANQQAANGGWAYTATQEAPLLDADITLALHLVGSPDPSSELEPDDGVGRARSSLEIPPSADIPPLATPW